MKTARTLTKKPIVWLFCFLIVCQICITTADADVLFSFTITGTAGANVISTNLFPNIGYKTSPLHSQPLQFTLFDLPLTTNDVGTTRTETSATSTNFNGFSALLTDGLGSPEKITFATLPAPDQFGGLSLAEGVVTGHSPDLFGYRIDSINLTLSSLSFSTPGSDPNHDGIWTDSSYSYTLFAIGTTIPEPSSASLLILSPIILWTAVPRRCRKLST